MRRIATAVVLATAAMGALAVPAGADPVATFCGSVHVTVNGSDLVSQDNCQVLPPQ